MESSEIVKAVLELAFIALEIYFIVWTIKSINKIKDKQEIIWEEIQQLKRDGKDYFSEIKNTKNRLEKIEEKDTPE